MGSALEATKRQILDRIEIIDVISEHVSLKRRGQRWVGLCPFHAEKTPSFTVSPDRGFFKCFGCGKGGDIFTFVQLREGVDFPEALRILADRAGVELERRSSEASAGPGRADLARVNAWAAQFFRTKLLDETIGRQTRAYLHKRNIAAEMADRFGIGLAVEAGQKLIDAARRNGFDISLLLAADLVRRRDRGDLYETFRNRVMFPIRDAMNRVVGFGGRTLVDDPAKYLNTRQNALFEKGRVLYGIDIARTVMRSRERAVVVEGYTDCIAAHQAGFTETVATLGTALTEAQVDLLRRYGDQIILLFDSDEAGEAAADRAIHVALPRCVTVRLARVPQGKDPCEFLEQGGQKAFSDLLNGAVDALEFKWTQARQRFFDGGSESGRREAVLDFMRVVAAAAENGAFDPIQRGRLVIHVAHLLGAGRDEVERLMFRLRPRPAGKNTPAGGQESAANAIPSSNEEQAAWRHLLEVLLNEPTLAGEFAFSSDIDRIADERNRRIASIVFTLLSERGEFGLAEVLERFHEPQDIERIMDLADRGARRGNFKATLALAAERLARASLNAEWEQRLQEVGRPSEPASLPDAERDRLAELNALARRHHGFSPRRLIRRVV